MTLIKPPEKVSIGLIGGTGAYDPKDITDVKEYKIYTPYGAPSDNVIIGTLKGRRIAFIPRHGRHHTTPPHLVNYRANIWALKSLGVKRLITTAAVGSLQDDYKPGELVITDQAFDWTRTRKKTFFEGGKVVHVSLADPFCPDLRSFIIDKARALKLPIHDTGTYVTMEGPQFSTKAESRFYRSQGFHLIGMTLHPEVNLAREAELCFANIAMITDYDVYADRPVSAEEIGKVMAENVEKLRKLLAEVIPDMSEKQSNCDCNKALRGAVF
ncbi:MAG: S-methyl-5'-thioadenosine phosphorylase [Promethearchaeota archaeon]